MLPRAACGILKSTQSLTSNGKPEEAVWQRFPHAPDRTRSIRSGFTDGLLPAMSGGSLFGCLPGETLGTRRSPPWNGRGEDMTRAARLERVAPSLARVEDPELRTNSRKDSASRPFLDPISVVDGIAATMPILVVDDDESIRGLVSAVLEAAGYDVRTARNGLDALQQFSSCRERIGLLLTDISMPLMNGIALAEALRSRHPDLPVLYISGSLDGNKPPAGAACTLSKPFTVGQLLDCVSLLVAPHANCGPTISAR